jgi:hypothetical protein
MQTDRTFRVRILYGREMLVLGSVCKHLFTVSADHGEVVQGVKVDDQFSKRVPMGRPRRSPSAVPTNFEAAGVSLFGERLGRAAEFAGVVVFFVAALRSETAVTDVANHPFLNVAKHS